MRKEKQDEREAHQKKRKLVVSRNEEPCKEVSFLLFHVLFPSEHNYLYMVTLLRMHRCFIVRIIAKKIYGAQQVIYSVAAEQDIALCEKLGLNNLAICVAKTQYSLSDNSTLLGRPEGFKITVRNIRFSAGAGFLVPMTGKITTMPGLPAHPMSEQIDVDEKGMITGLY